jgi:uncharacterized protein involved in response to NO
VTTGSLLGTWLWSLGPRANFLGAALFGLCGTLWFAWFVCRRTDTSQAENQSD